MTSGPSTAAGSQERANELRAIARLAADLAAQMPRLAAMRAGAELHGSPSVGVHPQGQALGREIVDSVRAIDGAPAVP